MKGPIILVRSKEIPLYEHQGMLYEWSEGRAYLTIERVAFKGKPGAVLCYYNPPIHQVGNPGLDAYLEGLDTMAREARPLEFLVLYGANDPVHAGGDLKESLTKLDRTLASRKEKESQGASKEEVERLYEWADQRIQKGVTLHARLRQWAQELRVVAVCGGGTRYGGSAEIALMADYLVGDARSAMCFSEATIGLIPGWSGVARTLVKAGLTNAEYMVKTSREVRADQLLKIGLYNVVVPIPFPLPKKERTGNPREDQVRYLETLARHDHETGRLLLPRALEIAVCPEEEIPKTREEEKILLGRREEIIQEVERRKDPFTYSGLWGKPLAEVREEISRLGRPLAPQAIAALEELLEGEGPPAFDEGSFVRKEGETDAGLYRDGRFRAGLVATLEQRVADFRKREESGQ